MVTTYKVTIRPSDILTPLVGALLPIDYQLRIVFIDDMTPEAFRNAIPRPAMISGHPGFPVHTTRRDSGMNAPAVTCFGDGPCQ